MNISLLKPKEIVGVYPDILEYTIRIGDTVMGTVIEFNKRGTFVAVGCNDGRIIIYDFQTKSMSKTLLGAVVDKFVMSITWFKNGRFILASYYDASVVVWDVSNSKVVKTFEYRVWKADICPNNENLMIVSLLSGPPILVELDTANTRKLPITAFIHKTKKRVDYNYACFNHSGRYIFVGNSIGMITVMRVSDLKVLCQFHVAQDLDPKSSTEVFTISEDARDISSNLKDIAELPAKLKKGDYGVKQIVFSRQGKYILVNCENSIRLFQDISEVSAATVTTTMTTNNKSTIPPPKLQYIFVREFKDLVTNQPFSTCGFSGWNGLGFDSEFVVATTSSDIFIWEREGGEVVKLLEGLREANIYVAWHPLRPVIVSCTNGGSIHIWGRTVTENWSSFAPTFSEIEYNDVYVEREDEFDEPDLDAPPSVKQSEQQDDQSYDEIVDVVGLSEEQQKNEQEYYVPTIPVRDRDLKRYNEQLYIKDEKAVKTPGKKKSAAARQASARAKKRPPPTTDSPPTPSSTSSSSPPTPQASGQQQEKPQAKRKSRPLKRKKTIEDDSSSMDTDESDE